MKKYILYFLFIVIVGGDLVGEFLQNKQMNYIFKPFILLWIGGFFLLHAKKIDKKVVLLAGMAFLFSWIGDLFMLLADRFAFFVSGIGSFLLAQLFYALLFLRTISISGKKPFLRKKPFWLIPYLAYGIIMYSILFPQLNNVLRIAVFVYIVAILTMSVMALNRFGNGHPQSFAMVYAGSLLFVVSDTLIAINRFLAEIPYEGVLIMLTYISAQFLIMRGVLMQYE